MGPVRRIFGCVSSFDAILIDDAGARLLCVFNDSTLDRDASWLPLRRSGQVRCCDGQDTMAGRSTSPLRVRRLAWAPGSPRLRPRSRADLLDLAAPASDVFHSEPGLAQTTGAATPGAGSAVTDKSTRGIGGMTLGSEGPLARGRTRAADSGSCDRRRRHTRGRRCLAWRPHAGARGRLGALDGSPAC
jgi:hypothetical protein